MNLLGWIILFSLFGGVLSVVAASAFLLMPEIWRTRALPHFVSFAVGALLGAAFLGLLGFFLLEKMVLWRHCHVDHCEAHMPEHAHADTKQTGQAAGTLILVGDGIHNFVDGVLIAAAFLTDFHLGVVTSLAVAAHEIPQEVGDFAVLLHSGFSRKKAFLYNILASLTTVVGALLGYFSLGDMQAILPYILAVAASSFIYIAVADLIPGLHKRVQPTATVQQATLIGVGVLLIYIVHSTLH